MTLDVSDTASLAAPEATTLDAIFALNARRYPDKMALRDPPDRHAILDGAPLNLSYAQADRAVQALASKISQLGLPSGTVIGVQLPNTVEGILTLLAITRAGMTAALLPLLWRRSDAGRALAGVGAKALIVGGRTDAADLAELALHLAADTFNIRFVCAFGDNLPDGVIALGDMAADDPATPLLHDDSWTTSDRQPSAPHDVAIITFDRSEDGPAPIAHTHSELLVGGLSVVMEAGIPPHSRLIGTMMPSSYAVLCSTVMPWLLSGGTLVLSQPFDASVLRRQIAEELCDVIVVPGLLADRLAASGLLEGEYGPKHVLAIWRAPERQASAPAWTARPSIVDVLAFGETGHLALKRQSDGRPSAIRLGPVRAPAASSDGPVVMTISRGREGTLLIAGPMAPHSALRQTESTADTNETPYDTGYPCRIDPAGETLILSGARPGLVTIGGYSFSIAELQDMVGQIDPDGVLAVLPDLLAGEKIAGFATDAAGMRRALAERGVSPLVTEAFRDRVAVGQAPAA